MAGGQFDALLEGWRSTYDDSAYIYYFNRVTGAVQWTRPEATATDDISDSGMPSEHGPAASSASTNASDALPENWESTHNDSGHLYYFNRVTRVVQWTRPEATATDDISDSGMPSEHGPAASSASANVSYTTMGRDHGEPRGRRRREGALGNVPSCGCDCVRARYPPPRNGHTIRCHCPFCGHRRSDGGQGCYRRTVGDPTKGEMWICRYCYSQCWAWLISGIVLDEESVARGET